MKYKILNSEDSIAESGLLSRFFKTTKKVPRNIQKMPSAPDIAIATSILGF